MRNLLTHRGVGPDANTPPAVPPKPVARPRDWLDDLLDTKATAGRPQAPAKAAPAVEKTEPRKPAPKAKKRMP